MRSPSLNTTLERLVIAGVLGAQFAFTPGLVTDPYATPKLLIQTAISFSIFFIALTEAKKRFIKYKMILVVLLAFVLQALLVLFFADSIIYQQFYGTYGRNTGFLSYLGYIFYLLGLLLISSYNFLRKMVLTIKFAGLISFVYGLAQYFKLVSINNLTQKNEAVTGFFGNINFQSSFLGIAAIFFFTDLFTKNKNITKIASVFIVFLFLLEINLSTSQQGNFVFLSGVTVILFLKIFTMSNAKYLLTPYLILVFTFTSGIILSLLNKGPLASFIYEASIKARGDYWAAGWKMTTLHPWFGVGFDGYGDWYRRTRTVESVLNSNKDVTTDAAHNVFLDISSSGGFPLLLVYLILVIYTLISAIRVLKRSREFNAPFVAIFAGWVAYQVQSLISINQLGLAIWGWVLTGLIIGYEINTRGDQEQSSLLAGVRGLKTKALSGLLVGAVIAAVPFYASFKMHKGFDSADVQKLRTASVSWPFEIKTMIDSAEIFRLNGYNDISLEIARLAVDNFPEYFDAWYLMSLQKNATQFELNLAQTKLKALFPLNPTK
jgi:O-antigen ligase